MGYRKWEMNICIKFTNYNMILTLTSFLVFFLFGNPAYALNHSSESYLTNITGMDNKNIRNSPIYSTDESSAHSKFMGKIIKAVEIDGLTRIKMEEMNDLLNIQTGEVVDFSKLRQGIRRAFRKKIFLDIQIHAESYQGGIKLKYIVKEVPVISKVIIKGNRYIWTNEIEKIFLYKEGEDFREVFLNEARNRLMEYYERKGFPDAKVNISLTEGDRPSSLNVVLNINEGEPLMIKSIDVSVEARALMKTGEFEVFNKDILDSDLEKLKNHYKKQKYLNPVVGPYQFTKGTLIIPVNKGPRLELSFFNNRAISSKDLGKAVPFMEEGAVTEENVDEAVHRIRNLYLSKGYYNVSVAAAVEKGDKIKVSFFIHEGEKIMLGKMTFEGVSVPVNALKKVLSLKVDEPYNENLLNDDREAIINFYNALGFLQISMDIEKNFYDEGRYMHLHFTIHEGPQIKVASVQITGNKTISEEEIRQNLAIRENSPYNIIEIRDARYSLLSLYKRNGYMNAQIDVESRFEESKAYLTFKINENDQYIIGKIIFKGNRKTKAKIIRREFTFNEGEIYNYGKILKLRQNLYKLGIFNEVTINSIHTGKTIDGRPVNDVLISLEESKAGAVEFSAGYGDYEQFRAMMDISYRNLGGYNRELGFKTEFSSVEERYVFRFREPWLFNQPDLPLKVFLLKEDRRAINLDTREVLYKIDKLGILVGIEKALTDRLKVNLDYEYSFTDTKDVEEGVILSREDTGTLGIGSLSPSLYYDSRDDPFNPLSGSLHSVVLKIASGAFLSEVEFIKTTFKSAWFFQLYKNIVFAFALRGGTAFTLEGTKELPLIERYFLGGRTTVRGYEHDMLGPKGTDNLPTGGNVFALANSEFRFSLGKGFGLVTFVDGGNVWRTLDDINEDLRYTIGAGLRYNTPVGPLRIDYGHKISRRKDESAGEVHFSFGHAF